MRGTTLRDVATTLLTVLLPSPCVGCDRPIAEWRPVLGLCVICRGRLEVVTRACRRCARPLPSRDEADQPLCGECLHRPPAYDRLLALYLYQPPLDAVVRHMKFGGLFYLGRHAARLLAASHGHILRQSSLVTDVPLHWRRRLMRGYNQAREIAAPLASELGIPYRSALYRVRFTRAQTRLPRSARTANTRGAFTARRRADVAGHDLLLVDDVVTTGATVQAAASALCRAGARSVTAVVLGRTPHQRPAERLSLRTEPKSGKLLEAIPLQRSESVFWRAPSSRP